MQKFQQELAANGGNPDLNAYADMLLKSPKNFKTGLEMKQKLKDQALYENYIKAQTGGVPTPAVGGMPAPTTPVNALAPTPATPVNAMAGEQKILNDIRMLSASNDPRAKAEVDVLKTQLTELRKIPTEVREFQYGETNPAFRKYQMDINRLKGTNVNLPAQEKAFESELGKGQAGRIIASQAGAQDAASIIDTVKTGRDIMKSGMITGAGADFLVNLNQGLKTAGIDSGYADASANSQAFAANMAGNVGKLIKQFGAGTGLSDADREFAKDMAGGRISLDSKAINRILDINEKAARNTITRHNKDVKGIKTNIPLEVEMPSAATAMPPITAVNPTTGARIQSTDGGKTWSAVGGK
jgi:hypothetical protein